MHPLEIRSADGLSTIRFTDRRDGSFKVGFTSPDLAFEHTVLFYNETAELVKMANQMAADPKGWAGSKGWISLEGDMKLTCKHDGKARVEMELELDVRSPDEIWNNKAIIVLDVAQLAPLATGMRRFFTEGDWGGTVRSWT